MITKNSMNGVRTLNTLNKNNKLLTKSLKRISSGMKINTAQDDVSSYAISENMKVQIRSLDQAMQNVQNDMAMMKTAESSVTSTLEILKTLKEKAIDAANDTNTDDDRLTIQKEVDQLIDQIDDNALVTFNGKHLLLGDSSPLYLDDFDDHVTIIRGLASAWINDALELIEESYGLSFEQNGNKFHELQIHFAGTDEEGSNYGRENATTWIGDEENTGRLHLYINMDIIKNINQYDENGIYNPNEIYFDRIIAHELTHGIMQSMIDTEVINNMPSWIVEGGTAEMTHGADERVYLSVVENPFDNDVYTGGFIAMRFFTKQIGNNPQDTMKKFMTGLINGGTVDGAFYFASGGKYTSESAFKSAYNSAFSKYGTENAATFLKDCCGIELSNIDTGAITGSDAKNNVVKNKYNIVSQASRPINWSLPSSSMMIIKGLKVIFPKGYTAGTTGGSLNFQTGTEANQSIHIGLFDMRAHSIGLIDNEGNKLDVTTIGKANQAIRLLDKIIDVVLDESINIGAIESRLKYTSNNLIISSENIQAAESTIRDADMAKEMTEYAKFNVLNQSAQAILAQENQNISNVLSLLQ